MGSELSVAPSCACNGLSGTRATALGEKRSDPPSAWPAPQEALKLQKVARAEALAYFTSLDAKQQQGLELQVGLGNRKGHPFCSARYSASQLLRVIPKRLAKYLQAVGLLHFASHQATTQQACVQSAHLLLC